MRKLKIFVLLILGFFAVYNFRPFASILWTARYLVIPRAKVEHPLVNLAKLPPCPDCNVLLISLDTLRADRLGFLNPASKLTPNLDAIAAKSLSFTRAFTNAFYTTPSHMTLFTSLYPTTHRIMGEDIRVARGPRSPMGEQALDKRYTTLAEVLRKQGYRTYWNAPLRFKFLDFEQGFARGFESIHPPPFDRGLDVLKPHAPRFLSESLKPLTGHKSFVFLHSYITHHPYIWRDDLNALPENSIGYTQDTLLKRFESVVRDSPRSLPRMLAKGDMTMAQEVELVKVCTNYKNMDPCFTRYSSEDRFWHAIGQMQVRRATVVMSADSESGERVDPNMEMDLYLRAYDGGVKLVDRQMGDLWKELERLGVLHNTIVAIVSDHGEELFDHGQGSHSSFYEHTARVPLLVYHPNIKTGMQSDQLVSLIDLMPMLLDTLEVPPPGQMQGRSPFSSSHRYVYGYALGIEYIRDLNWKLQRMYDGKEELFYLPLDPHEQKNLIDFPNPISRKAYQRLRQAREDWMLDQSL